ncbi:MAG: hypothetical protein NTY88_08845 [Bacteroidetes bacterium]|nr:hypothetical protein [Bacteroidota bacterium]
MEKETKNFDRKIEHIMNENSVAPPFGMWNRISSELESEALPIAAAAPLALIPKRAMFGFIAGVAVIGLSLITAYVVNNSTKQLETGKPITSIAETSPSVAKVVPSTTTNVVLEKANHIQVAKVKTVASKTTQQEARAAIEPSNNDRFGNNTDVPVPNQAIASNQTIGSYYFPPVDIVNTKSTETTEEIAVVTANQLAKQEEKLGDKKGKISATSSSEKRIKLKKHRRSGFTYGSLNRLNKHKTN